MSGTPTPEDAKKITGKVLVLHGADDPFVPPAEVEAFEAEMKNAGLEYGFVAYPGAVHAFTEKMAGDDPSRARLPGRGRCEVVGGMRGFLDQVFGKNRGFI